MYTLSICYDLDVFVDFNNSNITYYQIVRRREPRVTLRLYNHLKKSLNYLLYLLKLTCMCVRLPSPPVEKMHMRTI